MAYNQDVRGVATADNPNGIYEQYKPARFLSGSGVPSASLGELMWQYMDLDTAIQYQRGASGWAPLLNWASLPTGADGPNLNVDTIDSAATDNIIITAVNSFTVASANTYIDGTLGSYQGLDSCVLGSVAGSVLIEAATTASVVATAGALTLSAPVAATSIVMDTCQLSAALLPGGGASVLTSPTGLTLGGASSTVTMTGAGIALATPPAQGISLAAPNGVSVTLGQLNMSSLPIIGVSSLNGSSANTDFRYVRTNNLGTLSVTGLPPQSFGGVVTNFAASAVQYWEPAAGVVTPADFWAVLPLTGLAGSRVLAGYTVCFQTNTAAWQVTGGTMNVQIGYVAAGAPLTVANFTQVVSAAVPTLTSFPDRNAFAAIAIPAGARLAARLETVGATFTSAGCDALINIFLA